MIDSPLFGWVNRMTSLPARFDGSKSEDILAKEWEVSVALDESLPLHAAAGAIWQSLAETRQLTAEYLQRSSALVDEIWGGRLERYESELILSELGPPPGRLHEAQLKNLLENPV